jgi:hypothetical protein
MKAIVPNTFRTGEILDEEHVNDNLRSIARDIKRSQDRRYTYCSVVIPLDGLANTDTEAERTIKLIRPASDYPIDVVGCELSVYAATGATWTATCTDENSRTVTLSATTAGATTEAYDSSNAPLQSSASDLTFVLAGSAASTLTRACLVLHLRADRHQQDGGTLTTYTPGLVSAASSTAGSVLDTELTNAQAAVTSDETNVLDMRCVCLMANDLASAIDFNLPSGAGMTGAAMTATAVGAAARSVEVTDKTNTLTLNTTGTSNLITGTGTLVSTNDDPTDTTDDLVVTITPTGGTISRVFVFLWWS